MYFPRIWTALPAVFPPPLLQTRATESNGAPLEGVVKFPEFELIGEFILVLGLIDRGYKSVLLKNYLMDCKNSGG